MDILKELKSRTEQVEVIHLQDEKTTVNYEANQLKSSEVAETRGTAVRVVRNGRLGFSAASGEANLKKLSANVLESAAYGDQVPIHFPAQQAARDVKTYDPAIAGLPIPRLVEMGREILDMVLAADDGVRVTINLERSVQSIQIRNQTGLDIAFQRSPLAMGVEIDRIDGDDILILFDMIGTTVMDTDFLEPVRQLIKKLILARTLTSLQSGNMPVLFAPSGALALLLPLSEGLNGKNVYKGISPLIGKVGEKLFDEKFSLVDDGTLDGKFGSSMYDDEGVPHRRNALIDRGVLKGFLYDLKTAAQSGVESTGNGSRGLFSNPRPEPTNTLVLPGSPSLKEMIAGIDEGILIDDLLGLGQGNIISGAFSNPVSLAFKIEKGEIVGRVKNASIAGNSYELLRNIQAVSSETFWVYNSLKLPYILLPEMNVVIQGS